MAQLELSLDDIASAYEESHEQSQQERMDFAQPYLNRIYALLGSVS